MTATGCPHCNRITHAYHDTCSHCYKPLGYCRPLYGMGGRPLETFICRQCLYVNEIQSVFCNDCGVKLDAVPHWSTPELLLLCNLGFLGFMAAVYFVPAALIWLDVIPFGYRFHVQTILSLLVGLYCLKGRFSRRVLGLSSHNLKNAIILNGTLSVIILLMLVGIWQKEYVLKFDARAWGMVSVYQVLLSGLVQEFQYRSVLFARLSRIGIRSPVWQVSISSLAYGYLHIVHHDWMILVTALALGAVFGLIYHRYRNLVGVALLHSVVNGALILAGFNL